MRKTLPNSPYEHTVINIIRKLSPEHAMQLVNFARFLEFQIVHKNNEEWLDTEKIDTQVNSDEKWDELFHSPKAQHVMSEMAKGALEDYYSGKATDIKITTDGRLAPS